MASTGDDRRRPLRQRLMRRMVRWFSLYPPYFGAGVRIRQADPGWRFFEVEMRLRFWNANFLGTHFGGSLYSMCDPFFVLILIENLGPDYVVWDKEATIRFRRPGRGTVRARFEVAAERIEEIRRRADQGEVVEPVFRAEVVDEKDRLVAEVEKTLHVRRRRSERQPTPSE